jgi:uncharacterized Zn-finger protein
MNETAVPKLTVHILKEGRSFCDMPGVPGEWPDNHVYISYQDRENAKEANCPGCLARRESGPHLADRLNGDNAGQVGAKCVSLPFPDGSGGLKWACSLPDGVVLDASGCDASEEETGQAAHFDRDLGRWHRVG